MSEYFLHYIWQFQYFDKLSLSTTEGEEVQVFHPGHRNIHSGPDFFDARIKIGAMEWIGSVEIHINSSGWIDHHHDTDAAYDNVILHVVWKNDKPIMRNDGTLLPAIELKNRVDEHLLINFKKLLNSPEQIPCTKSFEGIEPITKLSALDKALAQRLEAKSRQVLELYERNNHDWEETCYQLLCKNFGFKVNADPFQQLARSLPYKLISKHSDKLLQVEALLFGQAGFLDNDGGDEYYKLLQREYKLLSTKYGLTATRLAQAQWRFLRLRPANFPSIRLAQLAALLYEQKNIFSRIIGSGYRTIRKLFEVQQSSYWMRHYRFTKLSKDDVPTLGETSVDNILINTVVPILATYSRLKDEQLYMDRAVTLLQEISSEHNAITKLWSELGLTSKSAFDSQAMIELYSNYCQKRRCLECTIGYSVLKPVAG